MVRPKNVARSRACAQCRRKRIKCDLKQPSCQRCDDSSIPCSGPVVGLMIVNQNASSFSDLQQANRPRSSRPHRDVLSDLTVTFASLTDTSSYDDILLFKFLDYFSQDASRRTWTARLPSLVQAKNHAAMKTAARAVSLAFAAQSVQNVSMAHAAREYYGTSLRYHQASFKSAPGRAICKKKAANALPVTVLLSYFEMIQSTSPEAWLEHSLAAERLFVLLGPDALEDDLFNHLYFIVRSNSAIRCFLLGANTQLRERKWSDLPMARPCGKATAIFNNLIDLIIWLSNKFNHNTASPGWVVRRKNSLLGTLEELNNLWLLFLETIGLDSQPSLIRQGRYDEVPTIAGLEQDIDRLPAELREGSAALTAAFFHATAIILLSLLSQAFVADRQQLLPLRDEDWTLTGSESGIDFVDISPGIVGHAGQIFALASTLRTQRIGCACMRMILPLAAVNRLSPSQPQRLLADSLFREWSSGDGLAGLSAFAFGPEVISSIPV